MSVKSQVFVDQRSDISVYSLIMLPLLRKLPPPQYKYRISISAKTVHKQQTDQMKLEVRSSSKRS
jgi:hypothetical protein